MGKSAIGLRGCLTGLPGDRDRLWAADRVQGERRGMLGGMAGAARQAGELTTALQSFARRPSRSPGRCRLGDTLAEMGRLPQISEEWEQDPDAWRRWD